MTSVRVYQFDSIPDGIAASEPFVVRNCFTVFPSENQTWERFRAEGYIQGYPPGAEPTYRSSY